MGRILKKNASLKSDVAKVAKLIGEAWGSVSDKDKARFQSKAATLKVKADKKIASYRNSAEWKNYLEEKKLIVKEEKAAKKAAAKKEKRRSPRNPLKRRQLPSPRKQRNPRRRPERRPRPARARRSQPRSRSAEGSRLHSPRELWIVRGKRSLDLLSATCTFIDLMC